MLDYVRGADRDVVAATSLVRLMRSCGSPEKWPVLMDRLKSDPAPLVRAAAAEGLDDYLVDASVEALLAATRDEYRLVRVRAAASLAGLEPERLDEPYRTSLTEATEELVAALNARTDDYTSHYNLGNFYMDSRDYEVAVTSFQRAIRLRPDFIPSHVNVAFAFNAMGRNDRAVASFRKAIELDPNSVPAHLNLAMLLGEQGQLSEAEKAFRKVMQIDPNSAVAAFNLGVIVASDRPRRVAAMVSKGLPTTP